MDEIYSYKATVHRVDVATRAADLLALAKSNSAYDPAIFDERTPFFWSAEVSNSQIDAYYTWMMPSTLRNFAAAARAGVSFLNSHRHNELPIGRSLDGQLIEDGERQRVMADFFTLPGLNLNGVTTDDFILGVRSGIVSDVSVGFHSGTHWCGICQQNYLSWDCPHLAGMKVEVKDKGLVTCTVGIDDAKLSEVSGVYDGATPDATIVKAQRMAEAGELKPDAVRMIEQRYRIRLSDKRTFAVAKPQEGKRMELEQQFNQIREVLGLAAEADVVATIVGLTAETERLRTLQPQLEAAQLRIKELEPQAADGATYRSALIEEALAEGVRANGDKFNRVTYEAALKGASLDLIRQMKNDWAEVGNSRFAGGRKTVDDSSAPAPQKKRSLSIPATAHKV